MHIKALGQRILPQEHWEADEEVDGIKQRANFVH